MDDTITFQYNHHSGNLTLCNFSHKIFDKLIDLYIHVTRATHVWPTDAEQLGPYGALWAYPDNLEETS